MGHFAKIENGLVTQVIVAEQDYIDSLPDKTSWVQTSYNTQKGVHTLGGIPLRKNYAGIGYSYDSTRDAFIPVKPFTSWIINEDTCCWEAPISMPNDGKKYVWDEQQLNWIEITGVF